jgi:hypothetical protein
MASQANGGKTVPGNLQVFGNAQVNGDVTVVGTVTASSVSLTSLTAGTHVQLTPTASPPAGATEGALYADTDHKLYFYNGTDWKEVAFV